MWSAGSGEDRVCCVVIVTPCHAPPGLFPSASLQRRASGLPSFTSTCENTKHTPPCQEGWTQHTLRPLTTSSGRKETLKGSRKMGPPNHPTAAGNVMLCSGPDTAPWPIHPFTLHQRHPLPILSAPRFHSQCQTASSLKGLPNKSHFLLFSSQSRVYPNHVATSLLINQLFKWQKRGFA